MDYETERAENIARNRALIEELGLGTLKKQADEKASARRRSAGRPRGSVGRSTGAHIKDEGSSDNNASSDRSRRAKLQAAPKRTSARIAATALKPVYTDPPASSFSSHSHLGSRNNHRPKRIFQKQQQNVGSSSHSSPDPIASRSSPSTRRDIDSLREGWTNWTATAEAPERDSLGTFHFADHPEFTPNKAPAEILAEGAFGGGFFRPVRSAALGGHVLPDSDWRELPDEWTRRLDPDRQLASRRYAPEANKYGVACGQSIEEWEAAGWIRHEFDPRGWFQWYCRFFRGRRCADDDRQVSRWARCVGERGRWRRALVKQYLQNGVRHVWEEDDDDDGGGGGGRGRKGPSPVVHQTCHHWAWELRQEALDEAWAEVGRG